MIDSAAIGAVALDTSSNYSLEGYLAFTQEPRRAVRRTPLLDRRYTFFWFREKGARNVQPQSQTHLFQIRPL